MPYNFGRKLIENFTIENFEEYKTKTVDYNDEKHLVFNIIKHIKDAGKFLSDYYASMRIDFSMPFRLEFNNISEYQDPKPFFSLGEKKIIEYSEFAELPEAFRREESQKYTDSSIWSIYNFFDQMNLDEIKILRQLFSKALISDEEWEEAKKLVRVFEEAGDIHKEHHVPDLRFKDTEDEFIKNRQKDMAPKLIKASEKINSLAQEGDIIILVGNSPQLIRYPLEKIITNKKIDLVSLALSGHPGQISKRGDEHGIIKNLVTDRGDLLYKEYMQKIGLTKEKINNAKKILIVDVIGSGGGIKYLNNSLAEISCDGDVDLLSEKICLVGVNLCNVKIKKENTSSQKPSLEDHVLFSKNIQTKSLYMEDLEKFLDRVSDSDLNARLLPNANSYRWDQDGFIEKLEDYSLHLDFSKFPILTHEIDQLMGSHSANDHPSH